MGDGKSAASLLRELREKQGRSLRAAASELGVAPSQLSRMERGVRPVGGETSRRMSEYYDVPAEILGLAQGQLPADIIKILQEHPDEIANLRTRYSS